MKKPAWKKATAIIVLIAIFSPLLAVACYVDDWSRDLTTNVAWTDPRSADESLRPLSTGTPAAEVFDAVLAFAQESPGWSIYQGIQPLPADAPLQKTFSDVFREVHLVRTTGVMMWEDDVWVLIQKQDNGCRVYAHSQSRVGKGDLGQNPRNLRELLGALRNAAE